MKKYSKFIVAGIILLVFIATFVFLWIRRLSSRVR